MTTALLQFTRPGAASRLRCPSYYLTSKGLYRLSAMSTGFNSAIEGNTKSLGGELAGSYISPLADIFEAMRTNAPTTLGTTQEFVDFHKERKEKKIECGIPEHALRFTTNSYGRLETAPFVHPNEHRVVLKVSTEYLPFKTQNEMEILREIVGNRLNDQRHELRLASNQFGSRIENKRHLVSMLNRIVQSCQRLAGEITGEIQQEEAKE